MQDMFIHPLIIVGIISRAFQPPYPDRAHKKDAKRANLERRRGKQSHGSSGGTLLLVIESDGGRRVQLIQDSKRIGSCLGVGQDLSRARAGNGN